MPVYATYRDPTFGAWFAANPHLPESESLMSRRQLTLLVLTLASMVATACGAVPTGPKNDAPIVVVGTSG